MYAKVKVCVYSTKKKRLLIIQMNNIDRYFVVVNQTIRLYRFFGHNFPILF